jgi:POT family proton-dependent oligopeptide transporter
MTAKEPNSADRWPAQVKYIVGNEACERFSFYGMKSILAGYIAGEAARGGLGQSADTATSIIHTFVFAVYFMPLFGAWLSDRLIGRYHTILWVSLFYCAGHGVLACSDLFTTVNTKLLCLYSGLALIAFGSGGIKPCVSAFMGDQFKPEQSHLLQKAYGAFYWSINLGSFFSFLVVPWVKNHHGYGWAFGVPGILMALATFIFWLGTKHYVRVEPARRTKTAGFIRVFFAALRHHSGTPVAPLLNLLATLGLPFVAMVSMTFIALSSQRTPVRLAVGWGALGCVVLWYVLVLAMNLSGHSELPDKFWLAARGRYNEREISAARSVGPILFIFALIPIFWSLFDQTNSTWVLQGEKMIPLALPAFWFPTFDSISHWFHGTASSPLELVHWSIGAEEMQSANPALVMILVPLLTLGVYPRLGRMSSPLKRIGLGLFLTAASYLLVAALQRQVETGAQLSVAWQTVPYLVLTTAEVLVSTTGLEFAFREAAPEMKSTIMSFWLLTVAFGNLLVTAITKTFSGSDPAAHNASVSTGRFLMYAGLTFVVAILFTLVAKRYRYRDQAAAAGK